MSRLASSAFAAAASQPAPCRREAQPRRLNPISSGTPPKPAMTRDSVPQTPVPPDIAPRLAHLTLPDVVDVAMSIIRSRASRTRKHARRVQPSAQHTGPISRRSRSPGSGAPRIHLASGASATTSGGVVKAVGTTRSSRQRVSVSWLLFSFGELPAFNYAKQAAFAASFNYNAAVQLSILGCRAGLLQLQRGQGHRTGDSQSVREDSANLAAAQARTKWGRHELRRPAGANHAVTGRS